MRGISFRWCEGRPKRTHNPEGNCHRCLDPFHDPRPAPTQALTSVLANCFPDVGSDLESHCTWQLRHKKCADLMMAISFRCGRATEANPQPCGQLPGGVSTPSTTQTPTSGT